MALIKSCLNGASVGNGAKITSALRHTSATSWIVTAVDLSESSGASIVNDTNASITLNYYSASWDNSATPAVTIAANSSVKISDLTPGSSDAYLGYDTSTSNGSYQTVGSISVS